MADGMPDESLMALEAMLSWFADIVNYKATRLTLPGLDHQRRKKFIHAAESYFWDESILYKLCMNGFHHKCVPNEEMHPILAPCHYSPYCGHAGTKNQQLRSFKVDFFGLHYTKMHLLCEELC